MTQFENQTASVTGGAQGIGRAVANRLAKGGARLALWDRDKALADAAAQEIGGGAFACDVDVADWGSVEAAMQVTLDQAGRADILVNSAGIAGSNGPLADDPVEEFRQITEINLLGTFHVNPDAEARIAALLAFPVLRGIRTPVTWDAAGRSRCRQARCPGGSGLPTGTRHAGGA